MDLRSVKDHFIRILHHLGKREEVGNTKYKLRGYFSNTLKADLAHEPFLSKVLARVLASRKGAFIDVGANVGQSLINLLSVDPQRPYLGFEPQVSSCFLVDQFIKDNGLIHAKVLALALSNQNSILKIFSSAPYDVMASLLGRTQYDKNLHVFETLVASRIFDEIVEEIGIKEIAVIKIDVEGAEWQVLQGMTQTLAQKRPVLIFEVLPNFFGAKRRRHGEEFCKSNTASAQAIYALLTAAKYKILGLDFEGTEKSISFFNLNEPELFTGSDYIAYPL